MNIGSTKYQRSFLIVITSFSLIFLTNCKSTQQSTSYSKSRGDAKELDEDIFFSDEELDGEIKEPILKTKPKSEKKGQKSQVSLVIKTARSYTGTPYKWGGMTRAGMDCSGLLCTSFRTVDIMLPRTSDEQSRFGKVVGLRDLEEGDLVFFSERRSAKRISHVGMVTEVNGKEDIKFIHASTKLGVVENNLYSPYYFRIFVKAVRPFN